MPHSIRFFSKGMAAIDKGQIDLVGDDLDVVLMAAGYVPDYANDEFMDEGGDDPIDHELNAGNGNTNGYHAGHGNTGRKALVNKTITSLGLGGVKFDADDVVWPALQAGLADIYGALIIKRGTADDTDARLIAYVDFDPIFDPDGNDLNLTWSPDGIFVTSDANA